MSGSETVISLEPTIPAPQRVTRKPDFAAPSGTWDCHAHIFGRQELYPLGGRRNYVPPLSDCDDYRHMLETIGVERAVIVQPSVYGTDNSCTFDAVKNSGGKWRGIAVIKADIPDAELEELNAVGFRGVRFNVGTFQDSSILSEVETIVARIKPLGWHAQVFVGSHQLPDLFKQMDKLKIDLVVDHMGYPPGAEGVKNPGFQALLARLREGRCWVKMSGAYRITRIGSPYDDVRRVTENLIQSDFEKLVWGTDWPHPWSKDMVGTMPNDGDLLDQFAALVPDEGIRKRILVDNPAKLYR